MLCYKGVEDTALWFDKAKPEPTPKDLATQIGVHLEEVAEMLQQIVAEDKYLNQYIRFMTERVDDLGNMLKQAPRVIINDRVELLDSIADQIVTAVGVARYAGMNIVGGLNEVNRSNFSKFDTNGTPILDSNRKIMKGPGYSKPDLTKMV